MACLKKGVNQIIVFDINEYFTKMSDPMNKLSAFEIDNDLSIRIKLNLSNNLSKYLNIMISDDFKQIVFNDQDRNFIVEQRDGY